MLDAVLAQAGRGKPAPGSRMDRREIRPALPLAVTRFYKKFQAHAWSRRRLAIVAVLMRESESIDRLTTGTVTIHLGPDSVAWDVADVHGKVKHDELIA